MTVVTPWPDSDYNMLKQYCYVRPTKGNLPMSINNARMISVFDYADHVIRLEVCLFSGREWLYLDEQLLEHKWNLLSCHSNYQFVLDGKPAEIKLATKVLRGAYDIQLLVDEQLVDTDQFDYMAMLKQPGPKRRQALQQFVLYTIGGFAFGFALSWLLKH
jgi:hypothetical protein